MTNHTTTYLDYLVHEKCLTDATVGVYQASLKRLEDWSTRELHLLSRGELSEFVMNLSYEGLQPATVHRIFSAVRGFFRFLENEGTIKDDPTEFVDLPQRTSHVPRFLSGEETDRLLDVEDLRDRALLELMYATGIRASEIVDLKPRDIDLGRRVVCVTGKGSKMRFVPFGESAKRHLEAYVAVCKPDDDERLFAINSRQELWAIVKRSASDAGIDDVSPHTLRHTFATHLMQSGNASIKHIMEMMGHAKMETTQIYTHVVPGQLKKNYEKFHPRA